MTLYRITGVKGGDNSDVPPDFFGPIWKSKPAKVAESLLAQGYDFVMIQLETKPQYREQAPSDVPYLESERRPLPVCLILGAVPFKTQGLKRTTRTSFQVPMSVDVKYDVELALSRGCTEVIIEVRKGSRINDSTSSESANSSEH